jgi:hypothetical protein
MSKRNTSVPQKLVVESEKKGKDTKPVRKEDKLKSPSQSVVKQSLPAKRPAGESLSKLTKEGPAKKSTSAVKISAVEVSKDRRISAVEMSKDRRRDVKSKFQSLTE